MIGAPMSGLEIIENVHMVDKIQNRIHRKKRINRKWAKRYGFTLKPKSDVFIMGNRIICHPEVANIIRKEMLRQEGDK